MESPTSSLPDFFKPILWSYDVGKLSPVKDKKLIIVSAINYGDLSHWRWLVRTYGYEELRALLSRIPITEIRPHVRKLITLIFEINNFNYAPRGARRAE